MRILRYDKSLLLERIRLTIHNVIELHAFLGLDIDVLRVTLNAFELFMPLDFGVSWRLVQIPHRKLV